MILFVTITIFTLQSIKDKTRHGGEEGGLPEERRRGDQVEAGPVEQAEEGAGAGGR